MNKKRETICASELIKTRGWTNSLIKKFLPTPDAMKTNPIFKSAAPMKLYNINKVKRIERSKAFKEAKEVAKKKMDSAQKATETKKTKTIKKIENLNFNIPDIDKKGWYKRQSIIMKHITILKYIMQTKSLSTELLPTTFVTIVRNTTLF